VILVAAAVEADLHLKGLQLPEGITV